MIAGWAESRPAISFLAIKGPFNLDDLITYAHSYYVLSPSFERIQALS